MASDGTPGKIPVASLVHGSQAPISINPQPGGGKFLPSSGNVPSGGKVSSSGINAPAPVPASADLSAAIAAVKTVVPQTSDPEALVQHLNKFLNDSGRPDQFRLDPASGGKLIQQINPASGAVIGEFSATEFPALARSVGVAGLLVDSLA